MENTMNPKHFMWSLFAGLTLWLCLFSMRAHAAEPVVCTLTTGTGAATSTTAGCTSGSVTWTKGSAVLIQCTTDTYVSYTTTGSGATVAAATSSSEFLDFTNNKDKVMLPFNTNDLHVSVLAATANGSCKFMITQRKKPTF